MGLKKNSATNGFVSLSTSCYYITGLCNHSAYKVRTLSNISRICLFQKQSYYTCRKELTTAGPRWLSLQRPACNAGPSVASRNLGLGVCPVNWYGRVTVPRLFRQAIWFMLNTCFTPGGLKCWYDVGRGCLYEQLPVRTLGAESPKGFPRHKCSIEVAAFSRLKEEQALCDPLGRETQSRTLNLDLSRTHLCLFPLWSSYVYYYIAVTTNIC